jgi:flagellar protein FliT
MDAQPDISTMYKKMLNVSHDMLLAADSEEWDKLIVLEQERSSIVETLQMTPNLVPDNQQERDLLIELIREIQVCDEKVRPMIVSWMAELRSMFESTGNELKLGKQYGSF